MERECKNLNKIWSDLKQLVQSRVPWRVGVVDVPIGIKEIKKKKKVSEENFFKFTQQDLVINKVGL